MLFLDLQTAKLTVILVSFYCCFISSGGPTPPDSGQPPLEVYWFFCFPFLFLLPGRLLKSLKEGDHTTLDGLAQEEPPPENGELDEKFSWTKHSVLFWIMDNFLPCVLRASTFRSNFDKSFPTNIWVVIHHSDIAFTLFVIQKDYDYCR